MNSGRPRCTRQAVARVVRRGFTLIELLLAVLLSGVVTTATAVIVVQSAQMRAAAEGELAKRWERVGLLDAFASDVRGILWSFGDESEVLALPSEPGRLIEVVTLADAPAGRRMYRRRLPARVAYFLEESPDSSGAVRLVREVRFLTDSTKETHRVTLAQGLRDAYVELHDGTEWRRRQESKTNEELHAVRLICLWWDSSSRPARRTVLLGDFDREGAPGLEH